MRLAKKQERSDDPGATGKDLNNEQADQRVTRSKWPKDREKKLAAMAKVMPKFIQDYYGGVTPIASAMSVTPADVREVINSSPELIELQEIAINSVEDLLLDRMMHLAMTTKSSAHVKFLLEKMFPDKYGKTASSGPSKSSRFSAPVTKPGELASAIAPRKGGKPGGH